jgi:hypothetical protein
MMKAIEINSKTDKSGHLRIDYKLDKSEKKVRVLILLEEEQSESDDEKIWLDSISGNPAFDFLNDPTEDIYSLNDGEPFND